MQYNNLLHDKPAELSSETMQYLGSQQAKFARHTIELDYDYWTSGTHQHFCILCLASSLNTQSRRYLELYIT